MFHLVETGFFLTVAILSAVTSAVAQWVYHFLLGEPAKVLPKLYYKEGNINRHILKNCSSLSRMYCPPWWMVNLHAQTVISIFLPMPDVAFKRELVKLDDGDILAIDWALNETENLNEAAPILVILPGLAGDANGYKRLALYAARKGLRPVVYNKRGHGGCRITTLKMVSYGDPTDFKQVIKYVTEMYPNAPLTSVGISAGSGLLMTYLGAEKENTPLVANVAISPAYDAYKTFNEYLVAPYHFFLHRGYRRVIEENKEILTQKFDLTSTLEAETFIEMEETFNCKIYGFKTASEYWSVYNPSRDQNDIKAPMLCISALDDPICVKELIPYSLFTDNDNIMLAALDKGGHCGFIEDGTLHSWAELAAIDYIVSVLEFKGQL